MSASTSSPNQLISDEKTAEEDRIHAAGAAPPRSASIDSVTKDLSGNNDAETDVKTVPVAGGLYKLRKTGILGFFGGLDRTAAEDIEREAENVTYTAEEERAVRRKVDLRVLPIIVLSYIFNQFDRTNIGNAHVLQSFNDNFEITNNNRWTLCLSIFYVGYCLLEMPSNVLQRHIGANRFFFMSLTFWGLSSLSFVYAKGYAALLILRVMLGIGEAGYYAGMIYYLSFWYTRRELAFRISLCMTGVILGWMGSLIAFGLVRAHTSVLQGWQFLYLIEAIPTLIMAIVILFYLPAFPFTAKFLTRRERAIAQARLKEHRPKSHGGAGGWQGLKLVMKDPASWMFAVLYCSCELLFQVCVCAVLTSAELSITVLVNICVATISYFLPTLIKALGYTSIQAQGLTVGPYLAGWVLVWAQAYHSDKTKDRGYHCMVSAAIALLGYVLLATCAESNHKVSYFAMYLITGGAYSLFPLVMSWAANTFAPTSKRGVGTAFIVSISNCVSIASPQIYFDPEDSFRKAHGMAGGFMFLAGLTAFIIRTYFNSKNKKRDRQVAAMSKEERELLFANGLEEIPDTDMRYRFMT